MGRLIHKCRLVDCDEADTVGPRLARVLRQYYRFSGNRIPSINREWLSTLMDLANSGGGLVLTAEPGHVELSPEVAHVEAVSARRLLTAGRI